MQFRRIEQGTSTHQPRGLLEPARSWTGGHVDVRLDDGMQPEGPALFGRARRDERGAFLQAMIDDDRTEPHIRRTT